MTNGRNAGSQSRKGRRERRFRDAFTLIELLVVLGVVSLLTAILLPATQAVRRQARALVGVSNLRQIAATVNTFANDNDQRYPPSVAKIALRDNWCWQEPTMLTGYLNRTPTTHRSVSGYLKEYIDDADVMSCPNAPLRYKHLQEAWDADDIWDNPDTPPVPDAVIGTYCLYWNYVGYLGEEEGLFRGPSGPARGHNESAVLITDCLGYGHSRSPNDYGSCERFRFATITEGTYISSAYWSRPGDGLTEELASLDIKPHAGFVDGHVESFTPADTRPMRIILHPETGEPYPIGVGAGIFYVPRVGMPARGRNSLIVTP